jgi:hypothetical protein
VLSQLDRGSEPQSPPEGLARQFLFQVHLQLWFSRSCRSRTCQPGFVDPALGAARQPRQYPMPESNRPTGLRRASARSRKTGYPYSDLGGSRTHNTLIKSQVLCHSSYKVIGQCVGQDLHLHSP